jgi:hypothetical protein
MSGEERAVNTPTPRTSLERLAQNELIFRRLNEGIDLGADGAASPEPMPFLCECSDPACEQLIRLTRAQYRSIRALPGGFVLARGHDVHEIEGVLMETGDFVVVEQRLILS